VKFNDIVKNRFTLDMNGDYEYRLSCGVRVSKEAVKNLPESALRDLFFSVLKVQAGQMMKNMSDDLALAGATKKKEKSSVSGAGKEGK
jgi:hypothetical protein